MSRITGSRSGGLAFPLATGAGTAFEEALEGVNPGSVAIAPVDPESIGADETQRERPDVLGYCVGIQDGPPTHLLHTCGAGTSQPEGTSSKESLMAVLIPFNPDSVVLPGDGVGDGGLQSDLGL